MPYFVVIKDSEGNVIWRSKELYAGFEVFYEVWDTIVDYTKEGAEIKSVDHPYMPLRAILEKDGNTYYIDVEYIDL